MSSQNIKTKPCGFNCGKKIYWDKEANEYRELMTKKKHVCPNYQRKQQTTTTTTTPQPKREYGGYSATDKSDWKKHNLHTTPYQQQERPKMANSFEVLTGSPREIRKMYEKLSELIREAGGKVHGSQRGKDDENKLDILVYYEVPELSKLGVQDKFNRYATKEMGEEDN